MSVQMQEIDLKQQRKGRLMFLAMAIFFAVPLLVVVAMYRLDWKPVGLSAGELIRPARLIVSSESLKESGGKSVGKFWTDKWNIVYITKNCEQKCMNRLHDMRQIHASLYKDIPRVQRVLLTEQQDISQIKTSYPDLLIINNGPMADIQALILQFGVNNEDPLQANRTYLLDPLGYLMMSYSLQQKAADIRKDMVRLLKYSWAG